MAPQNRLLFCACGGTFQRPEGKSTVSAGRWDGKIPHAQKILYKSYRELSKPFIRCQKPFSRQVTVPNISRKCCWHPERKENKSTLPCLLGSNHTLPFVVFLSLRKPWQQQGSAEHSDFSLGTVALACYLWLEICLGKRLPSHLLEKRNNRWQG